MMKTITCLVILLYTVTSVGQITLEDVRRSRRVKDFITLNVKTEKDVKYTVDYKRASKTLNTIHYFQVRDEEFQILVNFHNPTEYRITTSNKELEDELQKAANDFLSNAVSYLGEIQQLQNRAEALKVNNDQNKKSLEGPLAEAHFMAQLKTKDKFFNNRKDLEDAMYDLDLSESESDFTKRMNEAFETLEGIKSIDEIENEIDEENEFIRELRDSVGKVFDRYNLLKAESNKDNLFAGDNGLQQMFTEKINLVEKDLKEYKTVSEELIKKYTTLLSYFKNIYEKREEGTNTYELRLYKGLERSKRQELTITIEKINYNKEEKTLAVEATQEYLLHIRKSTTFIPVASSGVLYTNISFSQFGTAQDDEGNTILTQTASEDNEITVGAYLNLYVNNNWDVPVFGQVGVGPSKEMPLFFLGGGFSLFDRLTVSGGAVFTWFPELNDLELGQQIDGTSAIEDDITFRFNPSPRLYLGLSFNITRNN